jgi:hypothetical protein
LFPSRIEDGTRRKEGKEEEKDLRNSSDDANDHRRFLKECAEALLTVKVPVSDKEVDVRTCTQVQYASVFFSLIETQTAKSRRSAE